jgi:hypothetical protein
MIELLPCPFCGEAAVIENVSLPGLPRRLSVGCGHEECIGYQSMMHYAPTTSSETRKPADVSQRAP